MNYKSFKEQLKGNQHKLDKNKNGKLDAHDFKLLRKEEAEQVDEAMSPQQKSDFDRMMAGAMSRTAYNAKWKKPLKSDSKVIYGKNVKEETELDESMADSWKKVQSMDKGSVTGGKDEVKKRLAYLNAVHDHHKRFGNDTKKVKDEIEKINRSRIAEESLDEVDVMARSDYKVGPSGRKSHKQIVFKDGSNDDEKEKYEVREENELDEAMTDAQMKKREDYVKGMKKNIAGFKARYGERAKEVMYATATKLAKEEVEQLDEVGDTAKGQKLLQKVNKRAVDRLVSKRADTDPAYARKAMATHKAADERLKEETELEENAPVAPALVKHRIGVTVSDPNATSVTARKEKVQKFVRVTHSDNKEGAQKVGEKHFKKKGYVVHDSWHAGMVNEEVELDESVKIVDRDSDLDQEHFKLHVNGKPVHFVHHNYENSHASDSKDDIHYQVKKQLKHLSPQHQKAVTNAVHASYRIKEEVELDEGYVVRYHNPKSDKHGSEKHFDNEASAKKHADRGNSIDKIGGKYTVHKTNEKGHDMKEEVEQIDELSKSTIGSYIKKAKGSAIGAAQVTGMGSSMTGQKTQDKAERKVQKRAAGINKAVDRLTKEELEVDTLDEAADPQEISSAPHMYDAKDVKSAYYSKRATEHDKKRLARHLDNYHGHTMWRKPSDRNKMKEDLEVDILDEAVESGNKGNGYHGQHDSEVADKKYSAMHAKVKKIAGEAGHLRDAKKPNVMVKHYLDSKHGRHLAGNEHDHEYIKKDFGRFKKAYKPELHEGVDFDEEGNLMAEKLKFSDFIAKINEQLLEYESDSSGVYRHTKKATYGTSYQGDDDEDDKPKKAEPAVKRGRGRPAGSYSGTYKARSAETKAAAAAKAAATKAANKNK